MSAAIRASVEPKSTGFSHSIGSYFGLPASSSWINGLQLPQTVEQLVSFFKLSKVTQPCDIASPICPLVTPVQLQTVAAAGHSVTL